MRNTHYKIVQLIVFLFCIPLMAQMNTQENVSEIASIEAISKNPTNANINGITIKSKSSAEKSKVLKENQLIVEYNIIKSSIHISIIGRDKIKIKTIPVPNDLFNQIRLLDKSLTSYQMAINSPLKSYRWFTTSASKLYNYLIKPLQNEIKGSNLTFVLNNPFHDIPFEVLLKNQPPKNKNGVNYKDLNYLFKSHKISYAPHSFPSPNQKKTNNGSFLGFAPVDDYKAIKDINVTSKRCLNALKYSSIEINNIKKHCSRSLALTGEKATEQAFYDLSEDFGILHFSTHAIVDEQNPHNSYLVFSNSSDNFNDGKLYIHEILEMELSAKMAVLAACDTGKRISTNKQGISSLGNSFLKAGCSSVVMSLWSAYDESTSFIMEYFYSFLAKGASKDNALKQAKLEYINNADGLTSHPLYWANFVLIGDIEPIICNDPVDDKNPLKWIAFPFLAFGFWVGFKKINKTV